MTSTDIQLGQHQRLTVVESSPERLVVESTWDADADKPLRHYHPTQREDFEVLEGRLRVVRDGRTEVVEAGSRFSVAPGETLGRTTVWTLLVMVAVLVKSVLNKAMITTALNPVSNVSAASMVRSPMTRWAARTAAVRLCARSSVPPAP